MSFVIIHYQKNKHTFRNFSGNLFKKNKNNCTFECYLDIMNLHIKHV